MKLRKELIILGILASASYSSFAAEEDVASETKAVKTYTEEQKSMFLKTFGWTLGMQGGIRNLGLNKDEIASFVDGIKLSAEGGDAPFNLGEVMDDVQAYLQQRAASYAETRKEEVKVIYEKNRTAGKEFLDKLAETNKNIKKTETGLVIDILAQGDQSNKPTEEDSVDLKYVGKLINEKVFDESKSVVFPLKSIIAGLKEAIQLLGNGGRAVCYIPAELGYGDFDIPNIPAGSTLIFEIELLNVIKAPAQQLEQAHSEDTQAEESK